MKPGSGGRALAGLAHRAGDAQFGPSERTNARERERDLALVRSRSPSTSRSVLAFIGRDISEVLCSSIVSTQDRRSALMPSAAAFQCMLVLKGLLKLITDIWSTNYFENHELWSQPLPAVNHCSRCGKCSAGRYSTCCCLCGLACVHSFILICVCIRACLRTDKIVYSCTHK